MRVFGVRRFRTLALMLLAAVAVTLLATGSASALVMRMSAAQLTDAAATVVVAKAVTTDSHWTNPAGASYAAKGTIVTDVKLAVYDSLKGEAQASMTITVPGGRVGVASMPVEDAPRFVVGQMYVVFLGASGQVIAWREGQPQIVGDQVPALNTSLSALKSSVAQRVGHPAQSLRPWSGVAPKTGLPPASSTPPLALPQKGTTIRLNAVAPNDAAAGVAPNEVVKPAGPLPPQTRLGNATTIFSDGFESWTSSPWAVLSDHVQNGNSQWGQTQWVDNYNNLYNWGYCANWQWYDYGTWVTFNQLFYPGSSYYGNNDNTWIVAGPFNLSSYSHAALDFDLWCNTAGAGDNIGAWVSSDGTNFEGPYWNYQEGQQSGGDPPAFSPKRLDLEHVPYDNYGNTHNYCGKSQVWIAFPWWSDSSGVSTGACVDNVKILASNTAFPTIDTITPSSAPSGTYYVPSRNQSEVTITGSGFGASPGTNGAVAFYYQDGKPLIGAPVKSWSDTQIVCEVPIGIIQNYAASAGSGPVKVKTNGGNWSNEVSFDVPYAYGNQSWEASRCMYRINTSSMPADAAAAIDSATSSWNDAGSNFQFQDIGTCTTVPKHVNGNYYMPQDGHNDICFANAADLTAVIAFAQPLDVNGRMLEVDIVFNTGGGFGWATDGSSGAMDVQTIATHETGHWLNLRDLYGPGDTARIMYGFCDVGIVKRSLTQGEVDGIDWIYADHGTDTRGPVGQAKSLTVYRGKKAKIQFDVNDPKPSIGVATATISIKNSHGKVVKKKTTTVYTRFWFTWAFTCKLPRGRYSIVVTATDQLGFKQTKSVKGYLTVK